MCVVSVVVFKVILIFCNEVEWVVDIHMGWTLHQRQGESSAGTLIPAAFFRALHPRVRRRGVFEIRNQRHQRNNVVALFLDQKRHLGHFFTLHCSLRNKIQKTDKDAFRSACDRQPRRGQEYLLRRQ